MSELIDRQVLLSKRGKFAYCEVCPVWSLIKDAPTVAASPWHRVEDGLPDKYMQCLVADADGKCAVGYYRYDCEAWDSPAFGWIEAEDRMYIDDIPMGIGKVVAWMPIEPPKEDA